MTDDERLPPVLAQLGRDFRAAAQRDIDVEREIAARERRRRWPRRRRNALLFAVGALACAGAGAGASGLLSGEDGHPLPQEPSARIEQPAADPGVVPTSATADPVGGPPWALKVFTNAAGQDCLALGRLRGGTLGRLVNGTFRPSPIDAAGTCFDLSRESLYATMKALPSGDSRTVVYGIARDRRPVAVTIGGRTATVTPRGQGTFIVVLRGVVPGPAQVRTTDAAGKTVRVMLP